MNVRFSIMVTVSGETWGGGPKWRRRTRLLAAAVAMVRVVKVRERKSELSVSI